MKLVYSPAAHMGRVEKPLSTWRRGAISVWLLLATAGFAYGLLKAVRKRYIGPEYLPVAEKAVQGVIGNISEDGELRQVSFGTAMGSDLDYYRNIALTSMPYGQAMAILCLSEYLRSYI